MDAASLIQRHFGNVNGELCIAEQRISALAEQFGTPTFFYDANILERSWTQLKRVLPKGFEVYYSVKANPNPALLVFFLRAGISGLEIASQGEFQLAISSGCPAKKIIFAGPGKTEAELAYVLEQGIGEIHLESLREAQRISLISKRLNCQARIAVRINPSSEAQGGAMRMGGKPAPFGIDEEKLDEVLDVLLADTSFEIVGIHLFTGTQILDVDVLLSQYRKAVALGERVSQRLQRSLQTIDLGGGLGIPYFPNELPLDLEKLRLGLDQLLGEIRSKQSLNGTRFVLEPGRFLVGEAGLYLMRVIDVKVSRGKTFVIVDGGMHHHLAASGNLGQTIKRNYPVAVVNKLDRSPTERVDIVGPLCTPLDVLARGVQTPEIEVGDLVGIFQSGAYARSASPLGFLCHPTPPEVMVENTRSILISKRSESAPQFLDECRIRAT